MLPKQTVDDVAQLDISRIDFKDYDFGTLKYDYVRETEVARPDMISLRLLGTPNYWWFVMWFNGFSDPWNDLKNETIIKIPDVTRIQEAIKLHKPE